MNQFRNEAYLSIDPGEHGKVLGYEAGNVYPSLVAHPLQPEDLTRLMRSTGARVLVVEAQYVTQLKNARSVLELSFKLGMALGWLACTRAEIRELHMFEIAPASWQARQRRQFGIKGGRPKRKEMMELAFRRAAVEVDVNPNFRLWWNAEAKAGKEGLASALGIGDHWQGVAWDV